MPLQLNRSIKIVSLLFAFHFAHGQIIKSIVYDFDGFDLGSSTLPEGDYSYGDLTYQVAANPLPQSDVIGDRVLQLNVKWDAGYAAFGRGISRYLELSQQQDRFNFYFYNPISNGQPAEIEIAIADDDNNSHSYESTSDDSWRTTVTVTPAGSWQLISVPLNSLTDHNTGGNGVFDIGFTQNKGMLLLAELRLNKPPGSAGDPQFFVDMICFSQGAMPQGSGILSTPQKQAGDHCLLGAHQKENPGEFYLIPSHIQNMFSGPPSKKIRYVNTYMQWATNGSTTPHMLPGAGYKTLLSNGYRPIITWEPMFSGYAPNSTQQPDLTEIVNGDYDTYLDDFGDQLKSYDDTIIIRLMHEFDGDWYPWCIATNQNDPQKFVNAFRHIVNRVRNRGAAKVLWMWCPNNDFTPQAHWNWIVWAYPGDNFVDIVGTDVYNAHYPSSLPWWRSFRWQTAEIYYYLTHHFPTKPFFICELASRERTPAEPQTSQTKGEWLAMMDKDLQSYFRKTRGLVFFSENKSQTWAINSSASALASLQKNVWDDDYYFMKIPVGVEEQKFTTDPVYPNPAADRLVISPGPTITGVEVKDAFGRMILDTRLSEQIELDTKPWPPGVYLVTLKKDGYAPVTKKIIKQ